MNPLKANYLVMALAVVNVETSEWSPVLSGVPQGTVLGPLLLSLYINISTNIDSEIRLFADDRVYCMYHEIRIMKDSLKFQKDIDRVGCWARKWGMRFQPVKCKRKRTNKIEASYTLEGTVFDSMKYLVTITHKLRIHILATCVLRQTEQIVS